MKSKSINLLVSIALLLICVGFTSCSSDNDGEKAKTYIQVKIDGNNTISESDDEPITVSIELSNALESDLNVNLQLSDNDNEVVSFDKNPITIKAGEKLASAKIVSNKKGILNMTVSMNVTVGDLNQENVVPFNESNCLIMVKPCLNVPELTAEQQKLIEGYNKNMGIDFYRLLGQLPCKVEVLFSDDDKDDFNSSKSKLEFEGKSIITLSEKSTAATPVLKMTDNPMGLTQFLFDMIKKQTTNDVYESWYDMPYQIAMLKGIGFDDKKETFDATLDGLEVNASSVVFTGIKTSTLNDEERTVIPFDFEYSAWKRLQEKINSKEQVEVNDGDTNTLYYYSDLVEGGASLDPFDYVFYYAIDERPEDEDELSNWTAPTSTIDWEKGTLTFNFIVNYNNTYYPTIVKVVYNLHDNK